MLRAALLVASAQLASCFQLPTLPRTTLSTARLGSGPTAGLFDGVFGGGDGDRNPPSDDARTVKDDQLEAMQQMQEKRRDPIGYEIEKNRRRNVELATRAAGQGNLPSGWGSAVTEAGERYFYDKETKETFWDPAPIIEEMVTLLEQQQREEMEAMMKEIKADA